MKQHKVRQISMLVYSIFMFSINLVFHERKKKHNKRNAKNDLQPLFDQVWCVCAYVRVCVRITVSSGGPIARPFLSKGPVGRLRKVLCSGQRGYCSLASASCLQDLCQGRWQGSGRSECLLGPCCPGLQCRLAAGPCTYGHHYGKE